ncbi:MAG: uridine kinase [Bacteroidota bacterium]|nr:uridine kinase [Bacteroidota bacterium]
MLIIGIAGGSGSGKTTVVKKVIDHLPEHAVALVSQDAFYKDNGHLSPEEKKKINFDHPDSIEWPLLIDQIDRLKSGRAIDIPIYSYITCARAKETIEVLPRDVVIIEGILTLTNAELRKRFDIKIFVDADNDDRLMRIIKRDTQERNRSVTDVFRHYLTFVKPMHLQFIEPSKRYADLIIPQGGENNIAIDMLVSRIKLYIE